MRRRTADLMRRYLLEFREHDGSLTSEVLYFKPDDAGLVDPNGVRLSPSESFVMRGRTWRLIDVHVTDDQIRIVCAAAATADDVRPAAAASSRRAAR